MKVFIQAAVTYSKLTKETLEQFNPLTKQQKIEAKFSCNTKK